MNEDYQAIDFHRRPLNSFRYFYRNLQKAAPSLLAENEKKFITIY